MFLLERILNEQLFLLIIIATATILISYCIKNRPILLKSIALAHLKKTEFKFVSNNTQDQIVSILFWTSITLQTIGVFLFLEEKNNLNVFIILLFVSLVVVKRATIFISEIIFQTKTLLETLLHLFCGDGYSPWMAFSTLLSLQNNLPQPNFITIDPNPKPGVN